MSPRVLLLLFFEFSVSKSDPGPFKILKEWPKAIYDTKCLKNPGQVYYRSTKNRISGIKIFRNKIYLSVPREEDGVPVTLGLVSLHAGYKNSPIRPFPSWEHQNDKNCSGLTSVVGFEIDASGKMWLVDEGKTDGCLPKLVVFDLQNADFVKTGPENKKDPEGCETRIATIRTREFPKEIRTSGSRPGEIVVDGTVSLVGGDGPRAYIADSGTEDPGIFVYDFRTDRFRKFRLGDRDERLSAPKARGAGLALSPPSGNRTLYYSPRGSLSIYSAAVETAKKENSTELFFARVGNKSSVSDGMMADSRGNLYLGLEAERSVVTWNPTGGDFETGRKVLASDDGFSWIDTFAFDLTGNLYFTVNPAPDSKETASKIYYGRVGFVRSYLYKNFVPFNRK